MSTVIPIAIFIAFIFGVSPIIHKHIFNTVPTMTPQLLFIFGGIMYFIFTIIYALYEKIPIIDNVKTIPVSIIALFIFGGCMSFFANYLYFNIISKNASYLVSSLIFISPLFTLVLSYLILKEEITLMSLLGVLLIVSGVIIVAISSKKPSLKKYEFSSIRGD
jgi:drug/metabolite transporter (DMT)-like permease